MRYYLIAGEASGDLHGSNLMNALKMADKSAEFRFWGGDRMKSIADQLVKHYRDTAYMGFLEVVKNLPSIFKNLTRCKKDILTYQPDALILIDYPGFNMRIAKWAHDQGLKVFYYIAPQVWAWKAQRAHKLKHIVDALYVILPFEKNFFEKYDFQVKYVGHPLLDAISDMNIDPNSFRRSYNLNDKPILALLPGSRLQEIDMALPIMLRAVSEISNYQIIIAGLSAIDTQVYDHHITTTQVGKVIMDQTHALLDQASLALVSSGTATLEAALFDVPQIVCYKGNYLSYLLAKKLVKVPYISLVNLILDKHLVPELIQRDFGIPKVKQALNKLLQPDEQRRQKMGYAEIRTLLGTQGASKNVAEDIYSHLLNSNIAS